MLSAEREAGVIRRQGSDALVASRAPHRYDPRMNPETLAQELNREPFIPLRVRLSDGRTFDIKNPGLCFIAHLALYAFRAKPHNALAEDVEVVSLRHIVSVETIAPSRRGR